MKSVRCVNLLEQSIDQLKKKFIITLDQYLISHYLTRVFLLFYSNPKTAFYKFKNFFSILFKKVNLKLFCRLNYFVII